MDAEDPFVPLPMPHPPWAERVSVLAAAAVTDGETVPWSHGEDESWLDALENAGIASVLERALEERSLGVVVSVRSMGPHYAVVLDGNSADELLAACLPSLQRLRGPLPPGSRAVLTRQSREAAGMRVDMVDLA